MPVWTGVPTCGGKTTVHVAQEYVNWTRVGVGLTCTPYVLTTPLGLSNINSSCNGAHRHHPRGEHLASLSMFCVTLEGSDPIKDARRPSNPPPKVTCENTLASQPSKRQRMQQPGNASVQLALDGLSFRESSAVSHLFESYQHDFIYYIIHRT